MNSCITSYLQKPLYHPLCFYHIVTLWLNIAGTDHLEQQGFSLVGPVIHWAARPAQPRQMDFFKNVLGCTLARWGHKFITSPGSGFLSTEKLQWKRQTVLCMNANFQINTMRPSSNVRKIHKKYLKDDLYLVSHIPENSPKILITYISLK